MCFLSGGEKGALVIRENNKIRKLDEGDLGDVAGAYFGGCYYSKAGDLWAYNILGKQGRILIPAFLGKLAGRGRLFVDRMGRVWIEGASKMQTPGGNLKNVPGVPGEYLNPAPRTVDQFGHKWALISKSDSPERRIGALLTTQPNEWKLFKKADGAPEARWHSLISDDYGFIWAATTRRIVCFDPRSPEDGWRRAKSETTVESEILSLAVGPDGEALAGFGDGTIKHLSVEKEKGVLVKPWETRGLPDAPVRAIRVDHQGGIWVVCGEAFFRRPPPPRAWQKDWRPLPRLPFGNHDIWGDVLEGKLYIAGGMASYGYPAEHSFLDEILVFDPKRNLWSVVGRLDRPRCYNGLVAFGGGIWVVGGFFKEKGKRISTDTVKIFNPKNGKWRDGPPLDRPRAEPVVSVCENRIYVVGGAGQKKTYRSCLSIGPDETAWREEPDAPGTVRQANGCTLGDKIYVCAGRNGVFRFDPDAKEWSEVPGIPDQKAPNAPLCAAYKGEMWLMGGWGPDRPGSSWIYAPKTEKWRRGPDLPVPVGWGAAVEIEGELIIAGGASHSKKHKYYIFTDRVFALRGQHGQ